jgi:LacI family transcriptional regulator
MERSPDDMHVRPTMGDVATRAGVSVMTVSRVVNGTGSVREGTRRKVDAAMAALRYAPNHAACGLAGSRPIRIGFLYSALFASDLGEFLVGLSSQSSRDNVQILAKKCLSFGQEVEQLEHMIAAGVEGIILTPLVDSERAIGLVAAAGIPAITVDCSQTDMRVGTVGIDCYEAAYQMTHHLISLGHRRIGFVSGMPDALMGAERLAGYRAALKATKTECEDDLVVLGGLSYRCGLDAVEYLLDLAERPTAVFAGNDEMAAAAVAVAHGRGLDVPRDLTVTGFGDSALAKTIWPALTTIHQPSQQMARVAVQSLVQRVRGLRRGCSHQPDHISLDFELVRRQSDAAPRVRPRAYLPVAPK